MMIEQADKKVTPGSLSERAREIYERDIKHLVEPEHIGEFLSMDVETGEYEFGRDEVAVAVGFRDKHPEGQQFGMRIGYRTAHSLGGLLQRTNP